MPPENTITLIPEERIIDRIYLIRGQKVMLDRDLAKLHGLETKVLKQQVKRNLDRFPDDFMFELTKDEFANWRSQIVTSNSAAKMGLRYRPYAFTEQGVAMLSSVLRSPRAVQVNIAIMRTFVQLRQMLASSAELSGKLAALESKYDRQFKVVFDAIRELMSDKKTSKSKREIGFHTAMVKPGKVNGTRAKARKS